MQHASASPLHCFVGVVLNTNADVITDWNIKAGEIVTESKLGTPPAIRAMAIVQTAVYDAVNADARPARRSTPQWRRPIAPRSRS